jgi:hypothetical protein
MSLYLSPDNLSQMLSHALFINMDYLALLWCTIFLSHGPPPLVLCFMVNYITKSEATMTLFV